MRKAIERYFVTNGREGVNTILVDWSGGADTWNYLAASANTRLVGKQVAVLIHRLESHFQTNLRQKTTVIGFSLGGQAAGNAGFYYNQMRSKYRRKRSYCEKINKIIALDPAGPFFEGYNKDVRIDPTDGCHVQVRLASQLLTNWNLLRNQNCFILTRSLVGHQVMHGIYY